MQTGHMTWSFGAGHMTPNKPSRSRLSRWRGHIIQNTPHLLLLPPGASGGAAAITWQLHTSGLNTWTPPVRLQWRPQRNNIQTEIVRLTKTYTHFLFTVKLTKIAIYKYHNITVFTGPIRSSFWLEGKKTVLVESTSTALCTWVGKWFESSESVWEFIQLAFSCNKERTKKQKKCFKASPGGRVHHATEKR